MVIKRGCIYFVSTYISAQFACDDRRSEVSHKEITDHISFVRRVENEFSNQFFWKFVLVFLFVWCVVLVNDEHIFHIVVESLSTIVGYFLAPKTTIRVKGQLSVFTLGKVENVVVGGYKFLFCSYAEIVFPYDMVNEDQSKSIGGIQNMYEICMPCDNIHRPIWMEYSFGFCHP